MTLTFGSLFAGIGNFDSGFEAAGMSCLWQVEIEPDCRSVLARHFPRAERFVDVREVGRHNLKSVDIICGGFPCQDLSVAGKRGGLAGERSSLFYEMVRITDELRPMFLVWENVPGLISSDDGRDFARVLRALDDIGYSGAWTGLDAQWFGVAQRRRRIFGVFARASVGAARCAEILSLSSGLRRHPPTRGKARSGVAPILEIGARTNGDGRRDGDGIGELGDPMFTLQSSKVHGIANCFNGYTGGADDNDAQASHIVTHPLTAEGHDAGEDGTGRGTPLVACTNFGERDTPTSLTTSQQRIDPDTETFVVTAFDTYNQTVDEVTQTLRDPNGTFGDALPAVAFQCQGSNVGEMGTLRKGNGSTTGGVPFVFQESQTGVREYDTAGCIRSDAPGSQASGSLLRLGMGVRRLTPRECERLQGCKDDWTLYGADGEVISDSARYRMLGNAVADPCAKWIGQQIVRHASQ